MSIEILSKHPFEGWAESRQGGRNENQDSVGFSDTPLGLLALICDGMGGGPGGKTASLIATTTIIEFIKSCSATIDRKVALQQAIQKAHETIHAKVKEVPSLLGMGTTAVAILINETSAIVAHVGDSRLYKIRDGEILFRTQDDSMVGELVRKKSLTEEQARLSAQSNILTKAVGSSQFDIDATIEEVAYEKGDRFVLCSDGIWNTFPEPQLVKKFSLRGSVQEVVERVAMEVDEQGRSNGNHHDNLTLLILKTKINSKIEDKMTKKAKLILAAMLIVLVCSIIGNINQGIGKISLQNKLSKFDALEQELTDANTLNKTLSDSIKEIKLNSKADLLNAKGKAQDSEKELHSIIDSLSRTIIDLRAKNSNLQSQIENQKAQTATTSKKTVTIQKVNSGGLVQALTNFKNLTAKNQDEFKKKIKENKNVILSKIKAMNSSDGVKAIERKINTYNWNGCIDTPKPKKGISFTKQAQTQIQGLIDKAKQLK